MPCGRENSQECGSPCEGHPVHDSSSYVPQLHCMHFFAPASVGVGLHASFDFSTFARWLRERTCRDGKKLPAADL